VLACLAAWGRTDPSPELNVRALAIGQDPRQAERAAALLRESLMINPDQEIAHVNLGWLLVLSRPEEAERHFLEAARLNPDSPGAYFGLGLARLNRGMSEDAMHAFAIAALNDPVFLVSPWWRVEPFVSLRRERSQDFLTVANEAARRLSTRDDRAALEARYYASLCAWILGQATSDEVLQQSFTAECVDYFKGRPSVPDFDAAPINKYRLERPGYPVLMRQPGLAVPSDLFDMQENSLATGEYRFLFPERGWLPSTLVLDLLTER